MTAPTVAEPATAEIGQPGNIRSASGYVTSGPQRWEADPADPNVDLQFPLSTVVFDLMVKSDGQLGAINRAMTQPLFRAKWDLDTKGVRAEVVKHVRDNIGLPAEGDTLPRRRVSKVVFKQHLRHAVTSMVYGFAVCEQRYEPVITDDGVMRFHLVKLAPRLQRTITGFLVDADGGLVAVKQTPRPGTVDRGDVAIPVQQLVVYSREREGADWSGRSIFRTAYKHWLVKDAVLRIAAQIVERNGMGIPVVRYDPAVCTKAAALEIARQLRAGATAGLALPPGVTVEIIGVSGTLVDPIPLLKMQDESMSKAAMTMFLDLGHDNGARSLGDTFVDVFINSLQAEGDFIAEVFTEHVIRDLVESNWGVDEAYPTLTCGDLSTQGVITATDLKTLVDAGVITPDPTLEAHVRKQRGLPEAEEPTEPDTPAVPPADPNAPPPNPDDPFGLQQRINQPIPGGTQPRTDEFPVVSAGESAAAQWMAGYAQQLAARAQALADAA